MLICIKNVLFENRQQVLTKINFSKHFINNAELRIFFGMKDLFGHPLFLFM